METVEVVIRIPKDTFDAIGILQAFVDDKHRIKGNSTIGTMIKTIASGTVLPKGHGRLIDADALEYKLSASEQDLYVKYTLEDDAPTVIEADREVQDEK